MPILDCQSIIFPLLKFAEDKREKQTNKKPEKISAQTLF